jgi:tRNA nucleotidyltransferase (CCA-adding enzyme)
VIEEDPQVLLDRFAALPAAQPLLGPLAASGSEALLVGGAVRDLMLSGEPVDIDLIVPDGPEALAERLGAPTRLHDRFGTASLTLDGFRVDLARPRRETYSQPGALPEVSPSGLDDDLRRRDFTINAIALGVSGRVRGELQSVPGALQDLAQGTLRVLHPGSFSDDPTRLLRLARYASRLGFGIEAQTGALAQTALDQRALDTVSGARLGTELRLLAGEGDPVGALTALSRLGIAEALAPGFGLEDPDLAWRALGLLPEDGDRAALALGIALVAVPGAWARELLDRLAFSSEQRGRILAVGGAHALAQGLEAAGERPSALAAAVGNAGPEVVALAGAFGPAAAAALWLESLRHVQLEISGADLLAAGMPAGPGIGAGLRAAREAKLDGRAVGREAELAVALGVNAGETGDEEA